MASAERIHYVYILLCAKQTYYTGYTTDLERRYLQHVQGTACKYTRSHPPLALAASWCIQNDLSLALKLECAIKRLRKPQKQALVAQPQTICTFIDWLSEVNTPWSVLEIDQDVRD